MDGKKTAFCRTPDFTEHISSVFNRQPPKSNRMSKVKILVVEDEIIIADDICNTLKELGYQLLEPALNYTEALESLKNDQPDLALLDIQLGGQKDGIDLAWKIKEDFEIPFIFLTSNADRATVDRAKRLAPPAYLMKPFNANDLYTSIEIALYNFGLHREEQEEENTDREDLVIKDAIFVKEKDLFLKVKFADLAFIRSTHVYLELNTINDKQYVIRGSIKGIAKKLSSNFFQTNRSHMVNLDHLEAIDTNNVIVCGQEIPIGRTFRSDLFTKIASE